MKLVQALSRRLIISAIAATSTIVSLPSTPAVGAGLSRETLERKLSRVPVFTITNKDDSPYLTEMDGNGKRSGFFFLSPQEAVQALNDIKGFDPRASLSVVPLDSVFFELSKTADDVAQAPQPTAGTSTDLRLFRIAPLAEETKAAERIESRGLPEGSVPLFYEPSLTIAVDGREQKPYFFRLSDLGNAYDAQQAAKAPGLNAQPALKVITLAGLVAALESGAAGEDTLLVAASEAAAVVERMQGSAEQTSAAAAPAAPAAPSRDSQRGAAGGDPFFRSVPFAGGRKV